ncbi:tetratricopeptide repeat protein [Candidatus Pelagisphaera phototrophica]|uniref:tetratricopeptide repeat protein n=1 Tax=Candidatus Pelagisphaera phototrophica TaxID=2684113 RepID=UPI0019E0F088|nr:tetratricopeptide repeat protein [Candidatus Pelagisphaera phototrophica]QXD31251.1 sel1 repeat family protein [Candidatus Pelagisphaera phototrophica]
MLRLLFLALPLCIQFSVAGRSPEQVAEWLEESSWSTAAQYSLGSAYMLGDGVPEDKPEGFKWFKKAAEEGSAENYWRLGICYDEGQGVAKNPEEAFKCFEKAANKGHLSSQVRIGLSYIEGKGVEQDGQKGYAWLFVAAANGWEGGENLEKSLEEYLEGKEIKEAQELAQQMMKANADLAGDNSIPPTEDDQPPSEERVALVREGAERGHVDSMFLMGVLYRDGWGVDKDSEQAALWFNLAARQGDGSSAFCLSLMYLYGGGIEQDRVVANVWATVAFAKRIEGAGEILTMLNEELTEEEIDQSIQILTKINKDHPEMLGG